ncbi:MAG TPA: hypothetical protein VFS77_07710 [Pyrinomonadaceae bacterium]|nr:hypothetical protein [Pyrinomonadaceae bacterium]
MTEMKIPFTYGLMITLGVAAWVILAHLLVPNQNSQIHQLGATIFFNVLQFSMIYLGLKAKEREYGDKQDFKKLLKTGVAISFVYGLTACLFFAGVVAFVGTGWLPSDPGAPRESDSVILAKAFAGLFVVAMLLGLFYSAVIAFFLAKRRSEET